MRDIKKTQWKRVYLYFSYSEANKGNVKCMNERNDVKTLHIDQLSNYIWFYTSK